MDLMITSQTLKLTFNHSFRPGLSSKSFSTSCAARNGISAPIIKRANLLIRLQREGYDLVTACAGISKDEEEDLEDAEQIARRFLGEDLREWSVEDSLGSANSETDGGTDRIMETLSDILGERLISD